VNPELNTLLTTLYVLLTDRVLPDLGVSRDRRPGRKPGLSDAELLCLAVAQQLLGYSSETRWIRYARTHLTGMFPGIPQQSGYNKRLRAAGTLISATITALAKDTPSWHDVLRLVDSTPLPCGMSRETVKRSDLAGHAGYGYCASHSRYFWGFRLYLISTPEGMPVIWGLANPKVGEREVTQALLEKDHHLVRAGQVILGDKGSSPTTSALTSSDPTARTRRHASANSAASGNGSSQSSTPSKANSPSRTTVGAPLKASKPASPHGSWPSQPASGTTGSPARPANAP
jgi:hypothetical protein